MQMPRNELACVFQGTL